MRNPASALSRRVASLSAGAFSGALATAILITLAATLPAAARAAAPYSPNQVVVQYDPATPPAARIAAVRAAGAGDATAPAPNTRILRLAHGMSVTRAIARLRRQPDVAWAVPDYVAHTAQAAPTPAAPYDPNDPGTAGVAGGWAQLQWNFVGPFGVNAEQAWGNLIADGAPGGRGVIVAVLDTGIAYRDTGRFRRSPDFASSQFVKGFDFVDPGAYPVDHNGHGTHVASTIAEETGNGYGLTGLAYGVRLMSVRVLDSSGEGDAAVIAQGVRYAANHGAQVINLSLEFDTDVTASDIPELIQALRYAHDRGVVIAAAAGNDSLDSVAYPARAPYVISVGATTQHGCLADYSDYGAQMTIVAPGGGGDADLPSDPNCQPDGQAGNDVYQVTFAGSNPRVFGIPSGYDGTSMATPHVSATAALIIASGVLGRHPSPDAVLARLKATATPLSDPADLVHFGAGLVNAAQATAPGGPGAVTTTKSTTVTVTKTTTIASTSTSTTSTVTATTATA